MSNLDYLSLALAAIKDKVKQDIAEEFRDSFIKLLETEVQARRTKVSYSDTFSINNRAIYSSSMA